jgi:hypothetical protein
VGDVAKPTPSTLFFNYFDSSFWILPGLFLVLYGFGRIRLKLKLSVFELGVGLTLAAIFFFNNLAPPYLGGNMTTRGPVWARLYQPGFILMALYAIRLFAKAWDEQLSCRKWVSACVLACFALDLAIALGPALRSEPLLYVYQCFYRHGSATAFYDNLGKYGRSPLGIRMQRPGPPERAR